MNFIYSTRNAPGEPWIEKAPSIINQADGSILLELLCNGNPQPEVKWILQTPKGERELTGDGFAHKMKKQVGKYVCTLIIKKPKPEDQGTIKIVATNEHGTHSVQQNFMLKCTGKDIFKSRPESIWNSAEGKHEEEMTEGKKLEGINKCP